MKLYGCVQKTNYSFGRWYLELPEFWMRDIDYVITHPYLQLTEIEQPEIHDGLFEVYELDLAWLDFKRVFDLRLEKWKDKLLTFIKTYGVSWSCKGSICDDKSPLDNILFLGNYNVLASNNYMWSVMNHGPFKNDDNKYVEIWYYLDMLNNPNGFYSIRKIEI